MRIMRSYTGGGAGRYGIRGARAKLLNCFLVCGAIEGLTKTHGTMRNRRAALASSRWKSHCGDHEINRGAE